MISVHKAPKIRLRYPAHIGSNEEFGARFPSPTSSLSLKRERKIFLKADFFVTRLHDPPIARTTINQERYFPPSENWRRIFLAGYKKSALEKEDVGSENYYAVAEASVGHQHIFKIAENDVRESRPRSISPFLVCSVNAVGVNLTNCLTTWNKHR